MLFQFLNTIATRIARAIALGRYKSSPSQSSQFKGSLTRETLIKMTLRIATIVVISTAISYWHLISHLESQTLGQLEKYIVQRGQGESTLFKLAQDNQATFKSEFLARLQELGNDDPQQRFDRLFETRADGTTRLRPEFFYGQKTADGAIEKNTSGIIGKNVKITPDLRRRMVVAYDLINSYGPAWSNRFINLYVSTPENTNVVRWPGTPWGLDANADIDMTQEEWVYVADFQHNPSRKTAWTGLYYDAVAKASMVSCETPVDINDRHLITIGHDILVNELFDRAINERLSGAYNLIFREDGRLIVHPEHMAEIQQKAGLFDILTSSDRHIQQIFKLVTNAPSGQIVLENTQDREYLAITRLEGPNWYFVTVYPKALLSEMAGDTAGFILLLGGLSLLVEITVLFFVLQKQVAKPLKKLIQATEKVSAGNFDTQLNIARQDELGRLAYSFNTMAREVQTREMSLQQANRLKDEFLANTSHELRTPLNGIIGLAESLIDGATGELPPATRSNLVMIISSGRRLASLVNDILDFSKLRHKNLELQLKPVDLRSIADVVLTLSQPLVGAKDIQLVNAIPESLPPANADENRLQQIFHNLIGNAIKFTESGTVEVSAAMVDISGGNEAYRDKEQLAITISDTGIGIPEDKFDRIFESFEQAEGSTAREYGGTGLGLAVTTQLVELHEGTIYVKSEVGKGSQFTVTLPIARGSAAQSRSVPAVSESQSSISLATQNITYRQDSIEGNKPTIKVLIVDDEPINRQVLINHLSVYGYTLTQASNGLEAIALIEGGLKPDVILLDVMMPKMTGYEVTKKLRERFPSTELPILLLTAKTQVQDIVMGLNIGANDYLAKPIAKDELMARIGTQINMRSLRTENLRMNAELDIAKQLQQMVLPKAEELQAIAGLEIAGFMAPADEVGGDYYDILYSDDIVTIGIGDVTGHGLESGILMVMAQTAVRTLKEIKEIDPVRFLDTLNRTIYKNLQRMNCDKNLTLAILNYAEGRMSISGQHEEIIVVRKSGKIELIDTINLGFPIGLDDDIADLISEELVELEPGDGVVLYTDGIPEARDIDRKFYGLERLCEVVAINWHLSAEQIKQAAIDDLRGFLGEQKVFDDITLVVLKRTDEKNAQSSEGSLAVPCN